MGEMPRSSDEVEAAHLMGAQVSDLDDLPADAVPAPENFRAFQPEWSRSPPGLGRWTRGTRAGRLLCALGSRVHDALLRSQVRSPRAVILLLSLLKFSTTTSGTLLMIPMLRLVEDDICHKHYKLPHSEKIPEMKCKADEVQTAVAWLFGWQSLLGAVVNMLVAFPYGIVSDRVGRKPVLLLSSLGTALSFSWAPLMLAFFPELDIHFILVGMVFGFVGGGIIVMFNNVYAMAADVSTDRDRASNFVCMSVGAVLGGLIGPVAAGQLMERYDPWVPIRLVFCLMPLLGLVMALLPETLRVGGADVRPRKPQSASLADAVGEAFRDGLRGLRRSVGILGNRNVLFCLTPSLLQGAITSAHFNMLSQYVSKHFGWTLAQTSYLLSPLGFLHLAILAALPWLSARLTDPRGRFRCTPFGKDALLAKGSYLMIALGALVEGCSRDIAVFVLGLTAGTFGSASGPLVRAMITEFVEPEQTSRLYALTSMAETLGSPLGGPVLAWTFSVGLERKGGWRGLPWFYVAVVAVVVWAALMVVNEPRKKGPVRLASHGDDVEGLDYESGAEDER